MGLHYLTFMERNLERGKKLMPVRIMNSVGLNTKKIVNTVGNFIDSVAMNSVSGNDIWMKMFPTNIPRMNSNSLRIVSSV